MNVSGLLKQILFLSILITLILFPACANVQEASPASTIANASPTAEETQTPTPFVELAPVTPTNSPPVSQTITPITPTNLPSTPKKSYTNEEQAAIKEATNRMGNAIANALWCMEDSLPKNPDSY